MQLLVESAVFDTTILAQGGGSYGYSIHVFSTFWHVLAGAGGGILAGVMLSVVASQWPLISTAVNTLFDAIRVVPPLIFVPFSAIVFSGSDMVQFVSVAVYAALMMSVYTFAAIESIPKTFFQMATLLGAGRFRRMYTIQLPAILPHLLGPVRLVVAFSIGISVVAEYLASPTGIGRVMKYSMAFANVGLIMVGVLWAVALAFVFDAMTVFTIGAFTRWTGRRQLLEWMARAG
jgi:ABC-type nitrate/sulfonate/bicarbonate transport system permease component